MAKKSRSAKRGPTAEKDRRYLIAPDLGELCLRTPHTHYVTGTTSSGEQGIIINGAPMFHAYWFDPEGNYLRQESREVSGWSMGKPYEEQIRAQMTSLRAWVKELGLTPAPIRVKRFHSADSPALAIMDYPMGWDGAEWGEGGSLEDMLEWWHGLGAFVLFWNGFDYQIDKKGMRFQ